MTVVRKENRGGLVGAKSSAEEYGLRYILEVESARICGELDLGSKEEGNNNDDFQVTGWSSCFNGGVFYWEVEQQAWMMEGVERMSSVLDILDVSSLWDIQVVIWVLRSGEKPGLEIKIWDLIA